MAVVSFRFLSSSRFTARAILHQHQEYGTVSAFTVEPLAVTAFLIGEGFRDGRYDAARHIFPKSEKALNNMDAFSSFETLITTVWIFKIWFFDLASICLSKFRMMKEV
jgi:hypothetical protein